MFKKTLIILISSFVGIISAPDFLVATDTVDISDIDGSRIVETAIIDSSVTESVADESGAVSSNTSTSAVSNASATSSAPVKSTAPATSTAPAASTAPATPATPAPAPAPAPVSNPDRIDLAGHSIRVEYTDSTAVDAGGVVKMYKNKFFYGHNSGSVFGFLSSVSVGTTFTVTYNGVTTTYRVSNKIEYEKSSATTLSKNGVTYKMSHIANGYSTDEVRHSIALMTCSGTSYGNGDASHRLVLFADKI